jgi:hypothetical protein
MWTDWDDRPHPEAAYYGLASIALAGILLMMALPALQLALWLQATGYAGMGAGEKRLAAYGGYVGAGAVLILGVVGTVVGVRGLGVAARTGEPRVLCGVGIALSLFAAALWVMCGVAWHFQAWRFIS